MKTRTGFLLSFIIVFSLINTASYSQIKIKKKAPKFILTAALNYDYALSKSYGSVTDYSQVFDSSLAGAYFNGISYGMQQGGGIMVISKLAVGKKRKVRFNANIGYNLFYNTASGGELRTRWHVFNGSLGIEYNFAPKSKFQAFFGFEALYTLMFGEWQTDLMLPNNTTTNVYIKFKPASRFGLALNSGMEYRINKRTGLLLGYRAVWANIAPKQNKLNPAEYEAYINDSKLNNGIEVGFSKQIVYLQVIGGVSFYLKR
ncbi:MAG: hypothetical protein L0Y79_01655 [Chlorobi bacterium]|nr:hypothetical protein [Chlorobiota bacterium]MCI0716882.1 hypothetical protein [Chlorobiota bacterium]